MLKIIFLFLMAGGIPVAVAMAGSALLYIWWTGNLPPFVVIHRMVSGIDSFPLLAVPFFILAGNLMNNAGITNRIYNYALALVGWLKGGLGHVNVVGSVVFAGMSGTAIADAAGLGTIEIKAMTDHGYDKEFAVGVTAASATLGPIIPPSLPFVIYGMMANVSVGALFLAGILPYPAAGAGGSNGDLDATPATLLLFDAQRPEPPITAAREFRLTTPFTPDQDRQTYLRGVEHVLAYLQAGDAYQVNLAQRFSARYTGDTWEAFTRVQARLDAPHAAWVDLGDRQVLCFSPESFLELDGRQVVTRPIKGTRPRHADAAADAALAADLAMHPKDRAENLMIVDLLRNDLGRVCMPGSIRVPGLFEVESFHNVHHLVSRVTGELADGIDIPELLAACFPGGSITGAPKRRAMEIITELEPYARDIYCGSLFWVTADGRMGSNIAIRTFLARSGTLQGWAGAGIVADSRPAAEYQECLDKLAPIMAAFGQA